MGVLRWGVGWVFSTLEGGRWRQTSLVWLTWNSGYCVQIKSWTERLLSSATPPRKPPSSSSSSSSSAAAAAASSRRNRRPVITPTVSYHSTVTYHGDFDPMSRRYSLPTSSSSIAPGSSAAAALQRKVRFADPPESSVIEIESRRYLYRILSVKSREGKRV